MVRHFIFYVNPKEKCNSLPELDQKDPIGTVWECDRARCVKVCPVGYASSKNVVTCKEKKGQIKWSGKVKSCKKSKNSISFEESKGPSPGQVRPTQDNISLTNKLTSTTTSKPTTTKIKTTKKVTTTPGITPETQPLVGGNQCKCPANELPIIEGLQAWVCEKTSTDTCTCGMHCDESSEIIPSASVVKMAYPGYDNII